MHGLTTIAAIPSTGGAGMAMRGETNTRSNNTTRLISIVLAVLDRAAIIEITRQEREKMYGPCI